VGFGSFASALYWSWAKAITASSTTRTFSAVLRRVCSVQNWTWHFVSA